MSAEVVVGLLAALIAAGAAVTVAVTSNRLERWKRAEQVRLDRESRAQSDLAVLARYQRPLRATAHQLSGRIDNILRKNFGSYFRDPEQAGLAIRSTQYRIAAYFGVVQLIERELAYLELPTDPDQLKTESDLAAVGKAFARDTYRDRSMMVWREQQRAIGGLMLDPTAGRGIIGFEVFDQVYIQRFSSYFPTAFVDDLTEMSTSGAGRLESIDLALRSLVAHLDEDLGNRGSSR